LFGFDRSILKAADAWRSLTPTPGVKDFITALLPAVNEIQEPSNLLEAIRRFPGAPEHEQVLTIAATPSLLNKGPEVLDKLWTQLLDQQWRESLLFNVPPHILSGVSAMWIELAVRDGEKWRNHLPHLIALASEKTDDSERRDLLFAIQMVLSVAGSTDSAIRRIRRGERRADFSGATKSWHQRLENLSMMTSPWAAGRIRSVMAALSAP
jgi:hypothetical protein